MTKLDQHKHGIMLEIEELVGGNHEKETTLKEFIDKRIHFHGRKGYMFHIVSNYKKQQLQLNTNTYNMIAKYILECNHINTI